MSLFQPVCLTPGDAHWPLWISSRLGVSVPAELHTLGNLGLLALPKTALFCSACCPGDAILRAYDQGPGVARRGPLRHRRFPFAG